MRNQRQRLAVALSLVNDPELVFLDEPTTGLDPAARRSLWDIVEGLKAGGRDNGRPGLRTDYSPNYYAAFLIDPDGNNVEAVWLE